MASGPDEEELAGAYRVAMATNAGVARELSSVLTSNQPISHLDTYPDRLRQVSREDVMQALHRHFRPHQLSLAVAGTLADD